MPHASASTCCSAAAARTRKEQGASGARPNRRRRPRFLLSAAALFCTTHFLGAGAGAGSVENPHGLGRIPACSIPTTWGGAGMASSGAGPGTPSSLWTTGARTYGADSAGRANGALLRLRGGISGRRRRKGGKRRGASKPPRSAQPCTLPRLTRALPPFAPWPGGPGRQFAPPPPPSRPLTPRQARPRRRRAAAPLHGVSPARARQTQQCTTRPPPIARAPAPQHPALRAAPHPLWGPRSARTRGGRAGRRRGHEAAAERPRARRHGRKEEVDACGKVAPHPYRPPLRRLARPLADVCGAINKKLS